VQLRIPGCWLRERASADETAEKEEALSPPRAPPLRIPMEEKKGTIDYDWWASRKQIQYIRTYGTPATILGRVVDTQK